MGTNTMLKVHMQPISAAITQNSLNNPTPHVPEVDNHAINQSSFFEAPATDPLPCCLGPFALGGGANVADPGTGACGKPAPEPFTGFGVGGKCAYKPAV
jgi:hypothetical protein